MSLSDLELVQQAMAPTEPHAVSNTSNGNGSPRPNGSSNPSTGSISTSTPWANGEPTATTDGDVTEADDGEDDPLAGIDLSQLSVEDRASLAPIIEALKASAGASDDADVEEILKQLEAADDVADTLEGRLDSLLAHLGELEAAASGEGEADSKPQA